MKEIFLKQTFLLRNNNEKTIYLYFFLNFACFLDAIRIYQLYIIIKETQCSTS